MVMAIAAVGAGVLNTVEHAREPIPEAVRWLLVGALAVAMVSIMALTVLLEVRVERPEIYRRVDVVLVAAAGLALAVGLTDWGATVTLATVAVLLLAPIAVGLSVWLKLTDEALAEAVPG
jgi:4-amino-4-deoxy-L-arabinose transferase-like glycosyltransferase